MNLSTGSWLLLIESHHCFMQKRRVMPGLSSGASPAQSTSADAWNKRPFHSCHPQVSQRALRRKKGKHIKMWKSDREDEERRVTWSSSHSNNSHFSQRKMKIHRGIIAAHSTTQTHTQVIKNNRTELFGTFFLCGLKRLPFCEKRKKGRLHVSP